MPLSNEFFAEFPPVSKADWLARIAKDLKGRPIEELYWPVSDGIFLDYIGLHFAGPGQAQNPGAVLGAIDVLAREHGLSSSALRGLLAWDPVVALLLRYMRRRFSMQGLVGWYLN